MLAPRPPDRLTQVQPPGALSACEADLVRDVRATHRRRQREARAADAAAIRDANRPRFDVSTKGAGSSWSAAATATKTVEMFAQVPLGRPP